MNVGPSGASCEQSRKSTARAIIGTSRHGVGPDGDSDFGNQNNAMAFVTGNRSAIVGSCNPGHRWGGPPDGLGVWRTGVVDLRSYTSARELQARPKLRVSGMQCDASSLVMPTSRILAEHTIGVVGSGTDEHQRLAESIGELLARLEVNLLTGGGPGVMTSVAQAFVKARRGAGISIGILPCLSEAERGRPKDGYPNPFVELGIHTHLPLSGVQGTDDLSRNHINILSCVAIVALPGEHGTASEVALAVQYRKPVIAYSPDLHLVGRFHQSVPRATAIDDVRSFLDRHLRRAGRDQRSEGP